MKMEDFLIQLLIDHISTEAQLLLMVRLVQMDSRSPLQSSINNGTQPLKSTKIRTKRTPKCSIRIVSHPFRTISSIQLEWRKQNTRKRTAKIQKLKPIKSWFLLTKALSRKRLPQYPHSSQKCKSSTISQFKRKNKIVKPISQHHLQGSQWVKVLRNHLIILLSRNNCESFRTIYSCLLNSKIVCLRNRGCKRLETLIYNAGLRKLNNN